MQGWIELVKSKSFMAICFMSYRNEKAGIKVRESIQR